MKKIVLIIFALVIGAESAHTQQQLKAMIAGAMEHVKADNCADAFPILDEILSAQVEQVERDSNLNYSLNYYAGYCGKLEGQNDKAIAYFKKALELSTDKSQLPVLNTFIGETYRDKGEYRRAETYYKRAVYAVEPSSSDAALLWFFLAETHRGLKSYEQSLEDCDKAINIAKEKDLIKLEVACITHNGEVYNEIGDYPLAMKTFNQALMMSQRSHLVVEAANNHMGLALVHENLKMSDLARQNYDEALRLYTLSGNMENISLLTTHLLSLDWSTKEQSLKAAELYEKQSEQILMLGEDEAYARLNILMGDYKYRGGEYPEAVEIYRSAINFAMRRRFPDSARDAAVRLADILMAADNYSEAFKVLNEAVYFQSKQKPPQYLASIYAKMGLLYKRLERTPLAEDSYRKAIETAATEREKEQYRAEAKEKVQTRR
ncbi:MAG: tetratricopeptide repeat protein [Deferribacteraceae bacterium]|jgi:tetratricopeptide (TPR) repeat protein|nr:tetratricopeptide repeat protein [Deferribacteraceae bacterium]